MALRDKVISFEEILLDIEDQKSNKEKRIECWNSDLLAKRNNEKSIKVTVRKAKELKPFLN